MIHGKLHSPGYIHLECLLLDHNCEFSLLHLSLIDELCKIFLIYDSC